MINLFPIETLRILFKIEDLKVTLFSVFPFNVHGDYDLLYYSVCNLASMLCVFVDVVDNKTSTLLVSCWQNSLF